MDEKDPIGINFILDNHEQAAEIYEYELDNRKKKKFIGEHFKGKFSFSGCLLAFFINSLVLIFLIAFAFAIFIAIRSLSPNVYGEHCYKDSDCDQNLYLRCQSGICNCSTNYYYTSAQCIFKLMNKISCKTNYDCYGGQYCTNNLCDCSSDRFWNSSTLYCEKKITYGGYCVTDSNCAFGTNMNCISSVCRCSDPEISYWNGTYCAPVQIYMGACSTNSTCKPSSKLVCNITEYYPNKCNCLTGYYWDSANQICTQMKTINSSCTNTNECLSNTSLYCGLSGGLNACICQSNYYWSNNSCVKKASYGEVCTTCDDTLLLTCNSANYCSCGSNYFWNGTACAYDYSNGLNCNNNYDCDTTVGLYCDTTNKKCICNSTYYWKSSQCKIKQINGSYCINNIECQSHNLLYCDTTLNQCLCPSTHFWNTNVCTVKYDANVYCSNTIQCKDYNSLSCINGVGISSYSCQCPTDKYWSSTNCLSKKTYLNVCSNDFECQDSKGLICTGKCICPSTHYWTGTTCNTKKDYNDVCTSIDECKDYLAVQCINNRCVCNKMMYWDDVYGGGCLFKKSNNTYCNYSNPQCQDYAGLSCIGYICQCTYPEYWITNKCQRPPDINQYCDNSTYICKQGLVCRSDQSGLQVCQCPTTQYYNGSYCVDFRTYGQTCDFWSYPCDDSVGLVCPLVSTACNCPDTSVVKKCDCKDDKYWDGSKCTARSGFNGVCSQTYQCLKINNLVCNNDQKKCLCYDTSFGYWTGSACSTCTNGDKTGSNYASCVPNT